jgi:hypothetical protein
MRSVVALTAVMALAGIGPAGWSAVDAAATIEAADDVAPGVRDRPPATAPSGPGRKGQAPAPDDRMRDGGGPGGRRSGPRGEGGGADAGAGARDMRARDQQAKWRADHPGDTYRYLDDPEHRLVFATCLDETSHADMARTLARQADQQAATLFDAVPEVEVFIAVATPADVRRAVAGSQTTEGMYEHPLRRIITSDIGMVLRHEFTHAMHFGHMERLGQPHAMWVQEGIASLYERYALSDDGSIEFLPTARHNVARTVAARRGGTPIASMVAMTPKQFMAASGDLYPVARSFMEYLADTGKLRRWYRAYVDGFNEDRTGVRAIEVACGAPLAEVEQAWRTWTLARPAFDVTVGRGDRVVGVEVGDATDGAKVERVRRGTAAHRAGIRTGDVIVRIDGTEVRSAREWTAASAGLKAPAVPVVVRRGNERIEFVLRWDEQAAAGDRARSVAAVLDRALPASEREASCTSPSARSTWTSPHPSASTSSGRWRASPISSTACRRSGWSSSASPTATTWKC